MKQTTTPGEKSSTHADPAGLKSSIVKALFDSLISPSSLPTRQRADEGVFASTAALSPLKRSLDLSLSEGDLTLTDEKTPVVRSCSQNLFFPCAASEKSSSSLQSFKDRALPRPLRKLKEPRKDGEETGTGRVPTAEQLSWLRACRTGDLKRCKELLDTNPDFVHYVPPYHLNYSGVHIATNGRHYNLLRLLKEKGANFDGITRSGYTPLHLAAQNQDKETVDMLIHEFGVNTTIHDLMGYTYQHYADWLDYPDDDDLAYPLICRGFA